MAPAQILIAGEFRHDNDAEEHFSATNPKTGATLDQRFPISGQATLSKMIAAGASAADALRSADPERIAAFLEHCAEGLEAHADELVESAHQETGLPREPRLRNVELPRTTGQLRQAARAARERSYCEAVIDTKANIRLLRGPLGGPVAIFGPNNFPFAFNAIMGGDFAGAIAAGNPVIGKAHPCHPETTRLLAQVAVEALSASGLPEASVQMLYALPPALGLSLVAHPSIGATAFTGSRQAGLALEAAAQRAGKPIYLEMSAMNPLFILPGALAERATEIAGELAGSCTLGGGQFCTKPGLSIVPAGTAGDALAAQVQTILEASPVGTLLSPNGSANIQASIATLTAHGAHVVCGGKVPPGDGYAFDNTLLIVSGSEFLKHPAALQTEAFGAVHLMVLADGIDEMEAIARTLEGSLTGCIYTHTQGEDDTAYSRIEAQLRPRVGRLLNDKMPTGVAVSPAMNHGGPHPSSGHPGFTSVGMPGSIARFTALHCYDAVRPHRLPPEHRNENPTGSMWRRIDGEWSQGDVSG
jgi:NADP-dependent aldehyde dehydrogenase